MDVALQALQQAYSDQGATIERLEETLSQKLSMLDNIGWSEIGGYNEGEGPTLQSLQNLIPKLRELAVVNPLHVRGKGLRFSYIFGRPLELINVKTGTQKVIDDPDNKTALFSMAAYETNNSALFTDGNLVILKNITDKAFISVPLHEPNPAGIVGVNHNGRDFLHRDRDERLVGDVFEDHQVTVREQRRVVGFVRGH